ncbi:hypothetical protein [Thermomonospora catenispora]|uniref:hypothetical protein n=1 Tax=Thermomonospora catenispora TaxID=2493090 RepID=UPI0011237F55|nr:hypothetical protein [Thermomonospora catenispora]TNY34722.1 hypothetical protein EIO00_22300 [Thermomonospora catenispora]
MTASFAPVWAHLDVDPERTCAELAESFPQACIWLGEYTGSWWALVRDRLGRDVLLEGRTPAALYAELRAFSLRDVTAEDGSWTLARPAPGRAAPPGVRRPPAAGSEPHRPFSTAPAPRRRPAVRPDLHGSSADASEAHRPSTAVPESRRRPAGAPQPHRPDRPVRAGRPPAAPRRPPAAPRRSPAAVFPAGRRDRKSRRRRPLLLRLISRLRGRRPMDRDASTA